MYKNEFHYTLSHERSFRGLTKIGFSARHHATPCHKGTGFDGRATWGEYAEPTCSLMGQSLGTFFSNIFLSNGIFVYIFF